MRNLFLLILAALCGCLTGQVPSQNIPDKPGKVSEKGLSKKCFLYLTPKTDKEHYTSEMIKVYKKQNATIYEKEGMSTLENFVKTLNFDVSIFGSGILPISNYKKYLHIDSHVYTFLWNWVDGTYQPVTEKNIDDGLTTKDDKGRFTDIPSYVNPVECTDGISTFVIPNLGDFNGLMLKGDAITDSSVVLVSKTVEANLNTFTYQLSDTSSNFQAWMTENKPNQSLGYSFAYMDVCFSAPSIPAWNRKIVEVYNTIGNLFKCYNTGHYCGDGNVGNAIIQASKPNSDIVFGTYYGLIMEEGGIAICFDGYAYKSDAKIFYKQLYKALKEPNPGTIGLLLEKCNEEREGWGKKNKSVSKMRAIKCSGDITTTGYCILEDASNVNLTSIFPK